MKQITTSVGFTDAKGSLVAGGYLTLQLSQPCEIIAGGGLISPNPPITLLLDVNAKITPTNIYFADELTPSGTTYRAILYGPNGATQLADFGNWSIVGASADLSAMTPAAVGVSYPSPVVYGVSQGGTLAAAYALLPASGGAVIVPSGYTETLAADLSLNKNNCGIIFAGTATITMGSFRVVVPVNTNGVFIEGTAPFGKYLQADGVTVVPGLAFIYTGTGSAVLVGAASADTQHLRLKNLTVDTSGAGSSAIGINIIRTQEIEITNVHVDGINGANTQIGLVLDGANNFTGDSVISNFYSLRCQKGIQLASSAGGGTTGANNNVFVNGGAFVSGIAGSIGIDIQAGNGNTFYQLDIEAAVTTVNIADNVANFANIIRVYNGAETHTLVAGTASSFNKIETLEPPLGVQDSGTLNSCNRFGAPTGAVLVLNHQVATSPVVGTGADATVYTFTIPGNIIGPGKGVRVRAWANHTTGTGSIRWKMFFGTAAYTDDTATSNSGANGRGYWEVNVFNNAGVQNAQSGASITAVPSNAVATATFTNFSTVTSAENTVNAVTVKFTFNAANTEQVTGGFWIVEAIQ